MDESRTGELHQALLDALKDRTKLLCRLVGAWDAKPNSQVVQIGHAQAFVELCPVGVGSGRHTLRVSTKNTKAKIFYETPAAWFPLPHVAQHILTSLEIEAQWRQEGTHQRHRKRSAGVVIAHLQGLGLPPNMTLTPSETSGAFDLTATALTEDQVRQVVALLRPTEASADPGFWETIHQLED